MFDVAIWGNVANWAGATSTGVAATTAAVTYIVNSINNRWAQARQVHAQLKREEGSLQFSSVEIINYSPAHVSGLYLYYEEATLPKALLRSEDYPVRIAITRKSQHRPDKKPVYLTTLQNLEDVQNKNQIVGYVDRRGMTMGGAVHVEPGGRNELTFSEPVDESKGERLGSTTYWVGFTDAKGRNWERAALESTYGYDLLRKGPGVHTRLMSLHKCTKSKADLLKKLKIYSSVLKWLYRHRHEKVSLTVGAEWPEGTIINDETPPGSVVAFKL